MPDTASISLDAAASISLDAAASVNLDAAASVNLEEICLGKETNRSERGPVVSRGPVLVQGGAM